jgi:hypothetical protein
VLPFDLHVLGLPPAFTLSQDQTLHLNFSDRSPNALSAAVSQAPITHLHLHALNLWFLLERLQNGQPSTRQTPAQVTCAHCQRSSDLASAPHPFLPLNPSQKRPSEPHIIGSFSLPSTPFCNLSKIFRIRKFRTGAKNRVPALIEKPRLHCRRGFGVKTLAMTYSRMLSAHYHRRMRVSLPSSGWDRVVPRSYYHQGEGGGSPLVP